MLVGILSEPQGPAYLPPTGSGSRPAAGNGGHPDEWAGVSCQPFSLSSHCIDHPYDTFIIQAVQA